MHQLYFLILAIGILCGGFTYAEDEIDEDFGVKKGWVYVEPTYVQTSKTDGEYLLEPYIVRRNRWGSTFSLGYNSFQPREYEPNYVTAEFSDVYTKPELPLIEFNVLIKRNLSWGSLGAEITVGIYKNESDDTELIESSLDLYPVQIGALFSFDTLRSEPWYVPYGAIGVHSIIYKEGLAGNTFKGNTQVAPYAKAGVAFQLDWIDRKAARISYQDSGIESTYIYAEVKKLLASAAAQDPDFEVPFTWGAGMRVEF